MGDDNLRTPLEKRVDIEYEQGPIYIEIESENVTNINQPDSGAQNISPI